MNTRGGTVSLPAITGFDELPFEQASLIINYKLIPACEEKGVRLSGYGNHNTQNGEAEEVPLDVERIQRAFSSIDFMFLPASKYNENSSRHMKHYVENHPRQREHITNGDFIAAMLLKGYKARFGTNRTNLEKDCQFQVKYINN